VELEPIMWVLRAPLARVDIAGLCADLTALDGSALAGAAVHCDVQAMEPDLVLVEALARLQLTARRLDRPLRVVGAGPHLRVLLHLTGLDGILIGEPARRPDGPADG
jgi:hypothetical protein